MDILFPPQSVKPNDMITGYFRSYQRPEHHSDNDYLIEAVWRICVRNLTIIGSDNGLSSYRNKPLSEPMMEYR